MKYDYGLWKSVVVSILLFSLFMVGFLRPRKKREWRSLGIVEAFLVALFFEMYGFPLTIFILSTFFKELLPPNPFSHLNGHLIASLLLGEKYIYTVCGLGGILILLGLLLMGAGWVRIYRAKGELVTQGIYKVVRHPQYLGLILMSGGMIIQWATLLTLLMWPVLLLMYRKLAMEEEQELIKIFGEGYLKYKREVPAFFPRLFK